MSFMEEMHKAAAVYGIELTERQFEQFNCYFELLIEWNEKMNLTAITEPREVAVKHMVDSLSAYDAKIFQGEKSLIDVGTGAGFPGLPLKIFHPELSLTLLDSLNKRVKFLQTIVDALGLTNVCCVHARAEEAARQKIYRESFDIAVSRAVARMPILAEYCLPFVRRGGYFLALKGMKYEEEAQEVKPVLRLLGGNSMHIRPVTLPGLSDVRAVIYVKKEKTTSLAYPRKAGMPEKNPLGKIEKKDFAPQGRNNKQSGK